MGLAKETEGPWKALRVRGPMELSKSGLADSARDVSQLTGEDMTGVMHQLTRPFVEGGIAVFALSTWYDQEMRLH